MKEIPLILLGGGGHCKACIDVIEATGQYEIIGVLDLPSKSGMEIVTYKVIGADEDLINWSGQNVQFLVTAGQIKSADLRYDLFKKGVDTGLKPATIISPDARVSKYADIAEGTIIMHGAIINAGAKIGLNCIINTMANIEHDSTIGEHVHVSTGALINGECKVSDKAFIGSGAVILNGIQIGREVVIGAGSLVNEDCPEPGIYAGNPVKKLQ